MSSQQQSHDFDTMTCGRQMQRSITDVKPVEDSRLVQPRLADPASCQKRVSLEKRFNPHTVVINYGCKEGLHRYLL